MQAKLKLCNGCNKNKNIWKSLKKQKFCQECWNKHPEKITPVKSIPKPINKKSTKQQKLEIVYRIARDKFLKDHPYCQAQLPGCMGKCDQIHHKKGKIGELYLDTKYWLALDFNCHRWIEEHPEEAKKLGFSESRLDI